MHPPMYQYNPKVASRNFNDVDATLPVRPFSSQSYIGDSRALKRGSDFDETILAPLKKYRSLEPFVSHSPTDEFEDECQPPPPLPKDFLIEDLADEDSQPPPLPNKDYINQEVPADEIMESQPPPLPARDFESSIVEEPQESQPPALPSRDFLTDVPAECQSNLDSQPPLIPMRDYVNAGTIEVLGNSSTFAIQPEEVETGRTLYAVCSQGVESYRIEDSTAQIQNVNVASQSSMVSAVSLDSLATLSHLIPPKRAPVTRKSLPTKLTKGVTIKNLPPWPMFRQELKQTTHISNNAVGYVTSAEVVAPSREASPAAHQLTTAPPVPPNNSVTDSWDVTAVFQVPTKTNVVVANPVDLSMGELSALSFLCNSEVDQASVRQGHEKIPPMIPQGPQQHDEQAVEDDDNEAPAPPATDYVILQSKVPPATNNVIIKQEREKIPQVRQQLEEQAVEDDDNEAPATPAPDYVNVQSGVAFVANDNIIIKQEEPEQLQSQQRKDLSFICTETIVAKEEPATPLCTQQQTDLSFICGGLSLTMEERPETLCTQQRVDLSFICEQDDAPAQNQDVSLASLKTTQLSEPRSPVNEELEIGNLVIDMEQTLETEIDNNQQTEENDSEEEEDFSLLNIDDDPIEITRSQVIDDRQRSMLQFSSCLDNESIPLVNTSGHQVRENETQETLVVGVNFHPNYDNFEEVVISAVHAAFFG